jgi:hypothetical protein
MWENQNQEPTPAPEQEAPKPTYEELERAVSTLNEIMKESQAKTVRLIDWEYKAEKLEEWIDEEGDSLTKRQVEEICEIFNFDTEITKTITVSVEFELEITAERGFDFDDLDEGDFTVSIEKSYHGSWAISSENASISDISVDD